MTWVKLDDGFFGNRKARKAGKDGRLVYLAALCFSARELTDGRIDDDDLEAVLWEAGKIAPGAAEKLVQVGLWERVEDGYLIHDFHTYNPRADDVKKRREEDRLRKLSARNPTGRPRGQPPDGRGDSPVGPKGIPPSLVDGGGSGCLDEKIESMLDDELRAKTAAGERIGNPEGWKNWRRDGLVAELEAAEERYRTGARRHGERLAGAGLEEHQAVDELADRDDEYRSAALAGFHDTRSRIGAA